MRKKNISVFKFFIITYFIIMFIPVTTSVVLYSNLLSILDEYNEDKYCGALSQSQRIVDQYLEGISNIPAQILNNTESTAFLGTSVLDRMDEAFQPFAQIKVMSHLGTYVSSNPLLDDIYLYSFERDCFLSSETIIGAKSYGHYFQIDSMDYSTLQTTVLSRFGYNRLYPQTEFLTQGTKKNCFYFVTTVPIRERDAITGAILVSINSSALFEAVEQVLPVQSGYFYFYDQNQNLVAKSSNAPEIAISNTQTKTTETIDGVKYAIYRTTLPNAYNYAIAVPHSVVVSSLSSIRSVIYLSLILSCLISGAVALYFTKLNTRPIEGILNALRPYSLPDTTAKDEYYLISDAMNRLIDSNIHSREALKQSMPILRSNFLHSIISGELLDREEISQQMNQLSIDFTSPYYLVLMVAISGLPSASADSVQKTGAVRTTLSARLEDLYPCLHTDVNETESTYILGVDETEKSMLLLENTINTLSADLNQQFDIKLKVAVSNPFSIFFDVFYQYQDVKNNLERGIQTPYESTIWCSKNLFDDTGYYYPSDVESRIIHSFQRGNIDIVCETLDMVLKENYEQRALSRQTIYHLYSNVQCTIFKILYALNAPSRLVSQTEDQLSNSQSLSLPDFFQLVKTQLTQLHSAITNQSQENMSTAMLQYIETHYKDPALSRQTFSEHFNISEVYTSRFFKEHTGYRFTEYVTKVRMEAACQLLQNNKLTIDKIANAVGYNSDVSFRRVFKTYMGMTPKEYKATLSSSNQQE